MAFRLIESKTERLRFISTSDDQVIRETPEQELACRKYLETLDESLLTLRGKPVVWLLRPLDQRTLEIAQRNSGSKFAACDIPSAREAFRLSVEGAENWPAEFPPIESLLRSECDMVCLDRTFAGKIPVSIVLEGARVLLDTLFDASSGKAKGRGHIQSESTPGN